MVLLIYCNSRIFDTGTCKKEVLSIGLAKVCFLLGLQLFLVFINLGDALMFLELNFLKSVFLVSICSKYDKIQSLMLKKCNFDIKFLPCLLSGSFSLVTTLFSIFLRSLTTWSFQYFIVNSSTSFIARSRFWDCLISLSWPFTTARFLAFKKPYSNALTIMFLFSCCKGSRLFMSLI